MLIVWLYYTIKTRIALISYGITTPQNGADDIRQPRGISFLHPRRSDATIGGNGTDTTEASIPFALLALEATTS